MYAEPLSGSPRGDLKVEALKQQKLGQIKLLVGGAAWSRALHPHNPAQSLRGGKALCAATLPPPLHSQKKLGPSNGQGLAPDENPELSSQPRSFIGPVRKERSGPPTEARVGPGVPGRGPFPTTRPSRPVEQRSGQGTGSGTCGEGNGWQGRGAFHLLLHTAPAGRPACLLTRVDTPTSRPWRFCLLAFLDPHGPSCSSTFSRKASELLRAGLQGPQMGQPLR